MPKIRVCCDNGANCQSKRVEEVDLIDLGLTKKKWDKMKEDDRHQLIWNFVMEMGWIETWFEEVE